MVSNTTSRRPKTANSRPRTDEDAYRSPRDGKTASGDRDGETFLGSTVKTVLGQCAGFVDVAAFVIHSCRGEDSDDPNKSSGILGPFFQSDMPRKTRRKQGGTLEFPADGGFEDDVSALSANTLDEMEKLARKVAAKNLRSEATHDPSNPLPGQQLIPPPTTPQDSSNKSSGWGFSIPRDTSATDMSLGVATSSSSSTQEGSPRQYRDWHRPDGFQVFKAQVGN